MIIIVNAGMYKQDLLQTTMCTITLWNIRGINEGIDLSLANSSLLCLMFIFFVRIKHLVH